MPLFRVVLYVERRASTTVVVEAPSAAVALSFADDPQWLDDKWEDEETMKVGVDSYQRLPDTTNLEGVTIYRATGRQEEGTDDQH